MRHGFSLCELFVVISLVTLLASVAMPTVQMIRRVAVASKCAGNLRQVGLAFAGYANDWEGQYPAVSRANPFRDTATTSDAWFDRLPDFLDVSAATKVMQCAGYRASSTWVPGFTDTAPKSFKMNGSRVAFAAIPRHWLISAMRRPGELLLLVDSISGTTGVGQWGYAGPTYVTDAGHRGRVNGLAADAATWLQRPAPADWQIAFSWTYPGE